MSRQTLINSSTVKVDLITSVKWDTLFTQAGVNALMRKAMWQAVGYWRRQFLPLRFTDYIERKPFSYPGRSISFLLKKSRRADMDRNGADTPSFKEIVAKYSFGWDPWSPGEVPKEILDIYRQRWGRGLWSKTGGFTTFQADVRKELKTRVRDEIEQAAADGKFIPLVQGGTLRRMAPMGKARVTATHGTARAVIPIPRGDRQNKTAVRILGMIPRWELQQCGRVMTAWLKRVLALRTWTAGTVFPKEDPAFIETFRTLTQTKQKKG